jgi:uncharacterized protein YjbJ (UPF0337 family)
MDTLFLSETLLRSNEREAAISAKFGTILIFPRCSCSPEKREVTMDKEHVKGAADKAKGAIKDAAGKVTGDKELQAEGKIDKAKGAAHNVAGDVKDAARDASKEAKKD